MSAIHLFDFQIGPAKEYVEMLCDNPNLKFLVFGYHHCMMNGLSQSLYDKKVKFIRIDGDTPPSERPVSADFYTMSFMKSQIIQRDIHLVSM